MCSNPYISVKIFPLISQFLSCWNHYCTPILVKAPPNPIKSALLMLKSPFRRLFCYHLKFHDYPIHIQSCQRESPVSLQWFSNKSPSFVGKYVPASWSICYIIDFQFYRWCSHPKKSFLYSAWCFGYTWSISESWNHPEIPEISQHFFPLGGSSHES